MIDENTIGLKADSNNDGSFEEELPFDIGDINSNGILSIENSTFMQRILSEFIEMDLINERICRPADRNGDGYVNVKDVTEIQCEVAELI